MSGLDGFSMAFFQVYWDIIKEDFMKVFVEFHTHMKFEKIFNGTFISLILKNGQSVEVKDFRS